MNPPKLATWLLDRLGFATQNPALVGDLLEEFRGGRSRGWYWRQTLTAIAAGVRCNVRNRKNEAWAAFCWPGSRYPAWCSGKSIGCLAT